MVFTPSAFKASISASEPVIFSFILSFGVEPDVPDFLDILGFPGFPDIPDIPGILVNDSNASLVSTRDALGVGAESFAHRAMALEGLLRTGCQLLIAELHADGAAGDVDDDDVAVLDLADIATAGSLGRDMSDGEAAGATRETSVSDQGALLTEVHRLDIRGGVEHLLHAGASLGSLVGDDHTIAALHTSSQDAFAGVFL